MSKLENLKKEIEKIKEKAGKSSAESNKDNLLDLIDSVTKDWNEYDKSLDKKLNNIRKEYGLKEKDYNAKD